MNQLRYENIFSLFCGLFAFATLVFPKITSMMVILMIVLIIVGHIKKQLFWKLSWPTVFFVLLYLAYLTGIFFSSDRVEGLKYAEYKVSFLILPLLLSCVPRFEFKLNYAMYGLVMGILTLMCIGVLNSMNCYSGHDSAWFMYCFSSSFISPIHHPSYFSSFILFTIGGMLLGRKEGWWRLNLYFVIGFVLLGLIMYFLCLSLAGVIFLGIVLFTLLLYYLHKKIGYKILIPLSLITFFLAVVIGLNLPGFKDDIKESKQFFSEITSDPDTFLYRHAKEENIPGNKVRLIMWKISVDLIIKYPFGVGTGSVDEYLNERLEYYGLNQMVEGNYNPHNQYLQTTLEIGFIGLFILLGLIVSVIYIGFKYRSYLLLLLITGLAFNFLFESMFQRQSGIVFYSYWIPLIILWLRSSKDTENV